MTVGQVSPAEVLELERRRLRSLVTPDVDVAWALHSPDYELITPGGATWSRDEYLTAVASGALDYTIFEPEREADVAVRVFSGGAAVRYVAHIVVAYPGGIDDARVWHTDLWEHTQDGWQATWSQATRLPSRAG